MIISSSNTLKVVVRPEYVLHYGDGANKVNNTSTHNVFLEIIDSSCKGVNFFRLLHNSLVEQTSRKRAIN